MESNQTVSASVALESRSLRVELRATVDTAHPQFCFESPLSNLRENAEALLLTALASEGQQALRQALQKCEELLLDQKHQDVSLFSPKNMFPAQSFLKANGMSTLAIDMLALLRKLYAIEMNPEISAEISALITQAEAQTC